ncbi:3-deoxy-manno-octulosonate cytidylyltransferase [Tautonia plasticadhaerens]|uniref:3-deoxy-manno-octulosonate cytidylyltransferase n=1 Tax=Tautonia plasticadhaerens TaxID=2527974 RepID=A0A518H6Q5_9BACT|nr:3-deoxy-manno-octulosonate cytidylyltransferase [Tautonia plasticadhaerens]QDV36496.1 3-deoxy-manno-octulosonate cytidylyltransferase [Tautonia plasticadhaerens]
MPADARPAAEDAARPHRDGPADRRGPVVAIIPARYASSRLPGKPLLRETGRPLIQHVVEAAGRSRRIDRVIVATDDPRILDAVRRLGGEAVLTRDDHPSGTDRVAEVAARLPECRIVVNLQGDEPEIEPEALDLVVDLLDADPSSPMATICTPIRDRETYLDPSCVKVVRSPTGRALYFSRRPIPCHRDGEPDPSTGPLGFLHLGLYAYRREFLLRLATLPPSPLELAERLEQLRVLEAGEPIAVGVVPHAPAGIDTPEDYRAFLSRWRARDGRAA